MIEKLTRLTKAKTPYILLSDFEGKTIEVYTLDEAKKEGIFFTIKHNFTPKQHNLVLHVEKKISLKEYAKKLTFVQNEIKKGNTYLLNLTQPTTITSIATLSEIYNKTNAIYKIYYKDKFVCFSPESFVQINQNTITTYPMKGTIEAHIPNAKEKILADTKEMAEHIMVVDLLRNDLGIVAKNVRVEKFRYITTISTNKKTLYQVSSKISAILPQNWQENFGEIFSKLLPAGSISGTPKRKTVEIIKKVEGYKRGFFSGVFGYFDGENFDSCVMIRFIEKQNKTLVYKSGGGITIDSDILAEYNELFAKVYLP